MLTSAQIAHVPCQRNKEAMDEGANQGVLKAHEVPVVLFTHAAQRYLQSLVHQHIVQSHLSSCLVVQSEKLEGVQRFATDQKCPYLPCSMQALDYNTQSLQGCGRTCGPDKSSGVLM